MPALPRNTFQWGVVRDPQGCPRCARPRGAPHVATTPLPSLRELLPGLPEDHPTPATDGCLVEADGVCVHGHPSWLRQLGLL
jgi:hypothetical protein